MGIVRICIWFNFITIFFFLFGWLFVYVLLGNIGCMYVRFFDFEFLLYYWIGYAFWVFLSKLFRSILKVKVMF